MMDTMKAKKAKDDGAMKDIMLKQRDKEGEGVYTSGSSARFEEQESAHLLYLSRCTN